MNAQCPPCALTRSVMCGLPVTAGLAERVGRHERVVAGDDRPAPARRCDRPRAARPRGSSSRWRRGSRRTARCMPRRTAAPSGCGSRARSRTLGECRRLPPHARLQVPHEVPLIEDVRRRSSASTQRGRSITGETAATRLERWRRVAAVVAGQLQRQVAAERVARDDDGAVTLRRSARAARRRRRPTAPSDTASSTGARCRRSCAG